jgi:hypothetical protein
MGLDQETEMILTCLTTVLLNISAIDYNAQDYKNLARASYVCGEKEGCLKSFQKREQGIYRAMCGKKQEFDKNSFDKVELDVILYELRNLSLEEKKIKLRAIGLEVK